MHSLEFKQVRETMAREWETVASEREVELLEQIDRRSGITSGLLYLRTRTSPRGVVMSAMCQ